MKRPRTLIREIELNQARIAVLREDHARIAQEISHLVAANDAKVIELVKAEVVRLGLSRLPIHGLLSSLSKLGETVAVDQVLPASTPAAEAKTQTFVKFSRNASASNRQALEAAGLHWHGRDGGWTGNVTPTQLALLRRAFGERVEKPKRDAEGDPATALEDALGAVSSDVRAIATPPTGEVQEQGDTALPGDQSVSIATMKLRSSFGFPRR